MIAVKTGRVNPESKKSEYRFLFSYEKYRQDWKRFDKFLDDDIREHGLHKVFCGAADPEAEEIIVYDLETGEYIGRSYVRPAVILPCGQCLGCRTAYAASWADRLMLEAKDYDSVYFLTLTYDDDHVPVHETKDGNTVYSLEPDDLQLFVKALRRNQEYHCESNKIRFYAVGEYGERFHRPHYHLIVYGLILDDIKESHANKHGRMIHTSDTIAKIWKKGLVEVEQLTWELAAYAARYTVKKLGKKETDFYVSQNLVPEFSRMSLKPAIGWKYFDENMKEIYENDEILLGLASGLRKVKPPRYYDEKYDDIYPSHMEEIKGNRKEVARQHLMLKLDRFSGSYLELLHNQELEFKNSTKSLRRELEV